jgi:hypothetical protein
LPVRWQQTRAGFIPQLPPQRDRVHQIGEDQRN